MPAAQRTVRLLNKAAGQSAEVCRFNCTAALHKMRRGPPQRSQNQGFGCQMRGPLDWIGSARRVECGCACARETFGCKRCQTMTCDSANGEGQSQLKWTQPARASLLGSVFQAFGRGAIR